MKFSWLRQGFSATVPMQHKVITRVDGTALVQILKGADVARDTDIRAETIFHEMVRRCPVKTGRLRDHIEIRKTPDGLGRQVGVWEVDYAAAVNNGHELPNGNFVEGHHFMEAALDAARQ